MSGGQTQTNSSDSRSKDKLAIYVASDSMISSSGDEIEKQANSRKSSTNWNAINIKYNTPMNSGYMPKLDVTVEHWMLTESLVIA